MLALLNPYSIERKTVNQLGQLTAAFVGGKLVNSLNVGDLIAIARGEQPVSPKQARLLQQYLHLTSNSDLARTVFDMAVDALRGQGIEEANIYKTIGAVAPVIGIDPPRDREQLLKVSRILAERMLETAESADLPQNGVVKCPDCGHVHAI